MQHLVIVIVSWGQAAVREGARMQVSGNSQLQLASNVRYVTEEQFCYCAEFSGLKIEYFILGWRLMLCLAPILE